MPNINNSTVINQPYILAGNGGRKLVRLDNGWLVAVVFEYLSINSMNYYLLKSEDNGNTWTYIGFRNSLNYDNVGMSIISNGNTVYLAHRYRNEAISFIKVDVPNVENPSKNNVLVDNYFAIDIGQTELGNVSLAINEQGTEIHATWSSKNVTYPNSFNIRYAKGTINADGSVAWGAVEQLTSMNSSGSNMENPTIIIKHDGNPFVIFTRNGSTNNIRYKNHDGTQWTVKDSSSLGDLLYDGGTYLQSNPSAIFIPQEIAIKNPVFANATQGVDIVAFNSRASNSSQDGLRVMYSLDGGITWIESLFRTATASLNRIRPPSLTADKSGQIVVTYALGSTTLMQDVLLSNGNWNQTPYSSSLELTGNVSALFDLSMEFTRPLVIFDTPTKVGFYGTWTITTMSVPEGFIGTKDSPENFLKYAITTDGSMSTITEKINGEIVRTRSTISGTQLTVDLTTEQWDDIVYGKYANVSNDANTLTIEMGSNKWEYTFDKGLAPNDDLLSVTKAVQDVDEVFLPAVKSELIDAIRSKGGVISGNASWEEIKGTVESIEVGGKYATGTIASFPENTNFARHNGNIYSSPVVYFDTSKLDFIPDIIFLYRNDKILAAPTTWLRNDFLVESGAFANVTIVNNYLRVPYVQGTMQIPVSFNLLTFKWEAFQKGGQ